MAVLLVSVFTGQFRFFSKVHQKDWRTNEDHPDFLLTTHHSPLISADSIAIFASGTGSNAQKIIDHFRDHSSVRVALVVCNNPSAGVLKIAEKENIPILIIEKEKFFRGNGYLDELRGRNIHL